MEYLTNSVRKVGRFFSSPTPMSSLGKRKADRHEDNDWFLGLDTDSDSTTRDDTSEAIDGYYGYEPPQPPQKRIYKTKTVARNGSVTKRANEAVLRAQAAMGRNEVSRVGQADEQDIQEELERQQRQEEAVRHKLLEHQKKTQATATNPKKALVAALGAPAQAASSSKPKTAAKPLTPKTSNSITQTVMAKAQWSTRPNTRARQMLEEHDHKATKLLEDLQEPAYACRDVEIRDGVWKMMDQIEAFANEHFNFKIKDKTCLRSAFKSMQEETVQIIGCVASGGPAGASGWEDLFLSNDKRQALVCAIVGNVLVEQVFQHLFFGGTKSQIKEVSALQFEHRNEDGFDRNALYANNIRAFLTATSNKGKAPAGTESNLRLPANFNAHVNQIIAVLYAHLKPIHSLALGNEASIPDNHSDPLIPSLHCLTTHAALLSLHMRLDAHTAYHLTPVFKEQPFTRSEMECVNHALMISTHPRGVGDKDEISKVEQARRARLESKELSRMKQDQGLVQITLLPGITAYRLGGWEKPSSTAGVVQYEEDCEGTGVRARRLTDAWVYCRWGRQRVWEDGKPADKPETHGVAWHGGFVEFYPAVEGVRDPDPERTVRRETARKMEAEEELVKEGEDEDRDA